MTFPADAVLLLRGKYATLGAEYRDLHKYLQGDMHVIYNASRKVASFLDFRATADYDAALDQLAAIQNTAALSYDKIKRMKELAPQMEAIKSDAWGKEAKDE